MDECDKGEEINLMEYVSNNGENISGLIFFFTKLYSGLKNTTERKFPNA
jgi:hypothetical protein